jgi:hypothetical protein
MTLSAVLCSVWDYLIRSSLCREYVGIEILDGFVEVYAGELGTRRSGARGGEMQSSD